MKTEILAAAILGALVALSIWNLSYVKDLTDELTQTVDAAYSMAEQGDWERAEKLAEAAAQKWSGADDYTHIFIRHSEVDLTSDAFGDYIAEIYRGDIDGVTGTYRKLLEHLKTIYEMERITIRSVF